MLYPGNFENFRSSSLFFFLFPRRLIELHSPDSRNTLILRCKDTATAHSWFVAIHTNIMALLPQVLAELNAMLGATSTAGGSKEVKHIAWLAEQVGWEAGRAGSHLVAIQSQDDSHNLYLSCIQVLDIWLADYLISIISYSQYLHT